MKKTVGYWAVIGGLILMMGQRAGAVWLRVAEENFSNSLSNVWTYAGSTNALGEPLISHDAAQERLVAEWDQGNHYDGSSDPQVIVNSSFSAPLRKTLTDKDTFRFGATLTIDAGTIPDTLEFYQIANFGLYNLSTEVYGADRLQSDDFSGNSTLVRDANDLIEFNYFVNNQSFGFNPFVQGSAVARMPPGEVDSTSYLITGSGSDPLFHDTDMGANHYLPTETNLYVEVVYFGRATNASARRVYMAIYTDPTRTTILTNNGVAMYYWTKPAASNKTFDVTHMAFFNYAGVNFTEMFGGSTPDGSGAGSFDYFYVDQFYEPGEFFSSAQQGAQFTMQWAAESGTTYYVLSASNLLQDSWHTSAVVEASGDIAGVTNALGEDREFLRIQY